MTVSFASPKAPVTEIAGFERGSRVLVVHDAINGDDNPDTLKGASGEVIDLMEDEDEAYPIVVQFDNTYLGLEAFAPEELQRLGR